MSDLGRLKKVDPRRVWETEDRHFTPWLAEERNLVLLGEAIGIDLELEAQEKSVGPFRADILCKDTATDNWVLIENQLARTDHTHLGQLLTYAAGLKAVTIVWVATPFTEEHRATLDWLNDITDSKFNFFGLEVELWQIGESKIAPKFNIAAKPNDWSKTVSEGVAKVAREALSESKQLQLEFWTAFSEYVKEHDTPFNVTKPLPQHWMNISIGRTGFKLSAIASRWNTKSETYNEDEVRAELVIYGKNAKDYYSQLESEKPLIETEYDFELNWYNPPDKTMCRIIDRKTTDLEDRDGWENQFVWLVERLGKMHVVFAGRIKNLELEQFEDDQFAQGSSA